MIEDLLLLVSLLFGFLFFCCALEYLVGERLLRWWDER